MLNILDNKLNQIYHSNGKLLLTGEYVVLDGATALAIPTGFGQSLEVTSIDEPKIIWKSIDHKGAVWFKEGFKIVNDEILHIDQNQKLSVNRLLQILNAVKKLNPEFLNDGHGYHITTALDFPNDWGLGTSSTLINNIAQWTRVDPHSLLKMTFGGSGYDVAAAQIDVPFLYSISNDTPLINEIELPWKFCDQLFFVHLNKKQDSREGIDLYQSYKKQSTSVISEINEITFKLSKCVSMVEFKLLMNTHEQLISKMIKQPTIKDSLFSDYSGVIKSLGAWGGDFILATGDEQDQYYFRRKGFETIIPFNKMIK